MVRREIKIALGRFLLFLLFCSSIHAGDSWGSKSLRGVKPFKFQLAMGACSSDLTFRVVADLTRDVELKLRVARIPMDAKAELSLLILAVECLTVKAGNHQMGYAVFMQLDLSQSVVIEDTKQGVIATIWATTDGLICQTDSCPNDIRDSAKNMTDQFINDFLKANESK